jgi:molybdenum cofactor cytidylyltransferase
MSPHPTPSPTIAAVILAAGESRRFGSPKQLARLDGRTLLEHVLELAAGSGLDPIIAVVPTWLPPPQSAPASVIWVTNAHPERGMSESLRLGFEALPDAVAAGVILLGDQPTLDPESIAQVLSARGDQPIVAAWAGGHWAPPVLVERRAFGIVQRATGDRGLRDLLLAHLDEVAAVELLNAPDIDSAEDLHRLERQR